MEMLNDSQNEMEFKDDSRSTISPISSISTSSIDTSSTCERKQKIESNIQVYTTVRQVTKCELAQNFSIHNDYEHRNIKASRIQSGYSLKNLKDSRELTSVCYPQILMRRMLKLLKSIFLPQTKQWYKLSRKGLLQLDIDIRLTFNWPFIIASVSQPIINAAFIRSSYGHS
ncbi:hypothetical protein NPIL_370331 [Nephila pilipes]|uniref:Uncharacterized protein n=1 Tax=Nephila pilipes TaxID=299642 RepID=A0A8X6N3D5_NEPPI|nr:hypothetical protein NPIL_370331 [Nephila pilipes]